MDSIKNNPDWQKIEEDFRKMFEETKTETPVVGSRSDALKKWHITVPRQNEPS